MKIFKLIAAFIIFYFGITAFNSMLQLAKWLSFGNQYIEYGFYVFILILILIYAVYPLLRYLSKPSLRLVELMFQGDRKALNRMRKYLLKTLPKDKSKALEQYSPQDTDSIRQWVREYLEVQLSELDTIIKQYAFSISATVLVSPNPFIDGISILLGNSKMIYELSKSLNFRYTWKELLDMYFATMTEASITGLLEEFDDELEEVIEEIAEEFSDYMSEEAGSTIGDTIPFFNILLKASSPIIQASRNYAYIVYNGKRFICTVKNTYSDKKLTYDELKKLARKESRKERKKYLQEILTKLASNGTTLAKNQFNNFKEGAGKWFGTLHKKKQQDGASPTAL